MKNIKGNHKLGVALSTIGILTGLLILFLMASIYNVNIDGKIAGERPDEAIKGRFSMFLVAPVISTGLLIYPLLPGTKKMIVEWQNQ